MIVRWNKETLNPMEIDLTFYKEGKESKSYKGNRLGKKGK
jgi:hypothetical protein